MMTAESAYEIELERIQMRGEDFAKAVQEIADDLYASQYQPMSWDDMNEAFGEISGIDGAAIAEAMNCLDFIDAGAKLLAAAEWHWERQCLINAERALDETNREQEEEAKAERWLERIGG